MDSVGIKFLAGGFPFVLEPAGRTAAGIRARGIIRHIADSAAELVILEIPSLAPGDHGFLSILIMVIRPSMSWTAKVGSGLA
jgi:hypothetical protein